MIVAGFNINHEEQEDPEVNYIFILHVLHELHGKIII
jgi:hypothetical protein